MSIEFPTLAHFRHFIRRGGFSSLLVKIGKIFRQFSTKNADTSEQKSNFLKIFIFLSQNELRAMSDEKRLYFRIKRAGSSNYRGSVFLLPEFTRVYPWVYLHGSSAGECVLTCFSAGGYFFSLRQ